MYPLNPDVVWARIHEYERMTSNAPPISVQVPGLRDSLGKALVSMGSKLMTGNRRVRVVPTIGH